MADIPLHDKDYDLVSVVYHASQGADTLERYATDAKSAGDDEAHAYFEEAQEAYAKIVDHGKRLLKQRL